MPKPTKEQIANLLTKKINEDLTKEEIEANRRRSADMIKAVKERWIEEHQNIKPKKSNLKKRVKDALDQVTADAIHIKKHPSKMDDEETIEDINKTIELIDMMNKSNKKTKRIKTGGITKSIDVLDKMIRTNTKLKNKLSTSDINDMIGKIDELLKKPDEPPMKKTKQPKVVHKHKVMDASQKVMDYVHQFISIMDENTTPAVKTRTINKLRQKFYTNARPSEIDDANELIRQFREAQPKPEPKVKKAKSKAVLSDIDKKYKQCETYLKNQIKKGTLNIDEDTIKYVCDEAVSKGFKTMSLKFVKDIIDQ